MRCRHFFEKAEDAPRRESSFPLQPPGRNGPQAAARAARSRAQGLQGCTDVILETATNDIYAGSQTAAQTEANILTMAIQAAAGEIPRQNPSTKCDQEVNRFV